MRWPVRRNGAWGPGPFTVRGRKRIRTQLELLEAEVDRELLSREEVELIDVLCERDLETEFQLGIA
jgi:hypothetical protein